MNDCDQFALGSAARSRCLGEAGWSIAKTNRWRASFGIPPLEGEDTPIVSADCVPLVVRVAANQSPLVTGGCCGGQPVARHAPPSLSLLERTANYAMSLAKHTADGFAMATSDLQERRRSACDLCPHNDEGSCGLCGCPLATNSINAGKIAWRSESCPVGRWFDHGNQRKPFTREPTRNLLMHVWPTKNGAWQWNLDRIIERIDVFNGQRIIGIVIDHNTDSADAVKDYVAGLGFEFIVAQNEPKLAEMVTFIPSLEMVASDDPNEMTFRCHAKGAKHKDFGGEAHAVQRWADTMYETCLSDLSAVDDALESHAMAGSFRRYGILAVPWHFSGSFYWLRHVPIFQRNWRLTVKQYAGVEIWPGKMCKADEAACLFHDHAGNVYDLNEWSNNIQPELERWRDARLIHATDD